MNFLRWLEIEQEKEWLEEAKYGSSKMEQAANLLAAYLSKKLGYKLFPYGGETGYSETYSKSNGDVGVGFRFIENSGKAIRIDFNASANGQLTGVTYFTDFNSNPTLYIDIPTELNSIQAAKLIVTSVLETGSASEFESLSEAKSEKVDLKNLDPSLLTASGNLKRGAYDLWKKFGVDLHGKTWDDLKALSKKVKVTKAGAEVTSRQKEEDEAQEALDKKPLADADTIFKDLSSLTTMVLTTKQPSLVITGMAGIGKTYTVTEIIKKHLGPEGKKWMKVTGTVTPIALYTQLFLFRDRLTVFDDCDAVFKDADAVNILKAALDSYDTRVVSWMSRLTQDVSMFNDSELKAFYDEVEQGIKDKNPKTKLPNRFEYSGKIIFISNLPESKIDPAIQSRSFVKDITLSRQDVLKRIESLLPAIEPGVSLAMKREAFEALRDSSSQGASKSMNMRSVLKAIRIRTTPGVDWKGLIKRGHASA